MTTTETVSTRLSPEEVKNKYQQAVQQLFPSPSVETSAPIPEHSSLSREAQAKLISLLKRSYLAIYQKDYLVFVRSFQLLKNFVQQFPPETLGGEVLMFVADQEMWMWFDRFKNRVPTQEDQTYLFYIGKDLFALIQSKV